jgi:hypothetical protein
MSDRQEDLPMRNIVGCLIGAVVLLSVFSCEQEVKEVVKPYEPPASRTLTLSAEQLVFLDWCGKLQTGAKVIDKRLVAGPGVEFDIYFPSNGPSHRSIKYVSSGEGGRGALVGVDIHEYKAFSLKFTLVSIDEAAGPDITQEMVVGAVIGPTATGQHYDYEPVTLSFVSQQTSGVSTMPVQMGRIRQIGIYVQMLNPENWNRSGTLVRLRVEPVDDAVEVPWNQQETQETTP